MSNPDLTTYKSLSFDCYGPLVDWESGLRAGPRSVLSRIPPSKPRAKDVGALSRRINAWSYKSPNHGYAAPSTSPARSPPSPRSWACRSRTRKPGALGKLPGTWLAFPDTVAGLEVMMRHYKLVILSNIDQDNILGFVRAPSPRRVEWGRTSQRRLGVTTPSRRSFDYLFARVRDQLGVDGEKGELLHVARRLTAGHVPAKQLGLRSVWISRGGDKKEGEGVGGDYEKLKGDVSFEWRLDTIGQFAEEVDTQFRDKELR